MTARTRGYRILVGGLAVMALVAAACGDDDDDATDTTTGDTAAPEVDDVSAELLAAAEDEGALSLIWDLPGIADREDDWEALFEETYGFPVDITFTPGPSMPQNAAALIQEFEAGQDTQQDAFLGTDNHFIDLNAAGVMETLDPEELPAVEGYLEGEDTATPITSRLPGITYNSDVVDDPPESLADLLERMDDEGWAVASTPFAAGFSNLLVTDGWGEDETIEWVTEFADKIEGTYFCGDSETQLAGGLFDMLVLDCGNTEALVAQDKGAPLGHVIPSDAPFIGHHYTGLPKNSSHPNMAKLWINLLLTEGGQDLLYETGKWCVDFYPGCPTGEEIADYEADGVEFVRTNIEWALENDAVINGPLDDEIGDLITNAGG